MPKRLIKVASCSMTKVPTLLDSYFSQIIIDPAKEILMKLCCNSLGLLHATQGRLEVYKKVLNILGSAGISKLWALKNRHFVQWIVQFLRAKTLQSQQIQRLWVPFWKPPKQPYYCESLVKKTIEWLKLTRLSSQHGFDLLKYLCK